VDKLLMDELTCACRAQGFLCWFGALAVWSALAGPHSPLVPQDVEYLLDEATDGLFEHLRTVEEIRAATVFAICPFDGSESWALVTRDGPEWVVWETLECDWLPWHDAVFDGEREACQAALRWQIREMAIMATI
jgi:hypothetical protein